MYLIDNKSALQYAFFLPNDLKFEIMKYYPIISDLRKKLNTEFFDYYINYKVKKIIDEIIENVLRRFNI